MVETKAIDTIREADDDPVQELILDTTGRYVVQDRDADRPQGIVDLPVCAILSAGPLGLRVRIDGLGPSDRRLMQERRKVLYLRFFAGDELFEWTGRPFVEQAEDEATGRYLLSLDDWDDRKRRQFAHAMDAEAAKRAENVIPGGALRESAFFETLLLVVVGVLVVCGFVLITRYRPDPLISVHDTDTSAVEGVVSGRGDRFEPHSAASNSDGLETEIRSTVSEEQKRTLREIRDSITPAEREAIKEAIRNARHGN